MSIAWFPVVYGRTLNIDFRVLTMPNGARPQEKTFIERASGLVTRQADSLTDCHRIALASEEGQILFGVACLLRDVVGQQELISSVGPRANYFFAGFWGRAIGAVVLPSLDELNPSFVLSHSKYVRDLWQTQRRNECVDVEAISTPPWSQRHTNVEMFNETFNYRRDQAFIWRDSPNQRERLWNAAIRTVTQSSQPFSLYLGLNSRRDVTTPYPAEAYSYVLNATIQRKDNDDKEAVFVGPRENKLEQNIQNIQESAESSYGSIKATSSIGKRFTRVSTPRAEHLAPAALITGAGVIAAALLGRKTSWFFAGCLLGLGGIMLKLIGMGKSPYKDRQELEFGKTINPERDLRSSYRGHFRKGADTLKNHDDEVWR